MILSEEVDDLDEDCQNRIARDEDESEQSDIDELHIPSLPG